MNKTKYVYEYKINNGIILFHLLTFNYIVLQDHYAKRWLEGRYSFLEDEIYEYLKDSMFIVEDTQVEKEFLERAQALFSKKQLRVPNIVIYITNECNLRCSYCYTGYEHQVETERISENDVDSIFESIISIYDQNEYLEEKPIISLFGGEPLLPSNINIVTYIIEKIKKFNSSSFEIVTNLINIRNYKNILLAYGRPVFLKVTLNGNKEIHDNLRKFNNGKGTYNIVLNNIKYVLDNIPNAFLDVSLLIDKSVDLKNINELFEDLNQLGLLNNERIQFVFGHIQFRGDYVCPGYENQVIPVEDYYPLLWDFCKNIKEMNNNMVAGSSMYLIREIHEKWKLNTVVAPNFRGCDAIYPGRYCFFTDGKVYPCFDCVGMEGFDIGEYRKGLVFNENYKIWKNFDVTTIQKCNECKYVGFCNGGCLISNISKNHSIDNVYCENVEKTLENYFNYLVQEGVIDEKA